MGAVPKQWILRVTRTLSSGEEWDTGSGFPERAAGKSCIMAGAGSVAITVYTCVYVYIYTCIHMCYSLNSLKGVALGIM